MNEKISGRIVTLRPAILKDRKPIFEWLTNSDLTDRMMGPPLFPDIKIPSWQEFIEDYKEYFFDSSKPLLGRCFVIEVNTIPVGQINHDKIYPEDHSTELDIWLKNSTYIGKGYGSDAIQTLCNYLNEKFQCERFLIAPSGRNTGAIKAYQRSGFTETKNIPGYFVPDCFDAVVMIKTLKSLKNPDRGNSGT